MLELIIDTCDAEDKARKVLRDAGIHFGEHHTRSGHIINVLNVRIKDRPSIEKLMAANNIEIQWSIRQEDE